MGERSSLSGNLCFVFGLLSLPSQLNRHAASRPRLKLGKIFVSLLPLCLVLHLSSFLPLLSLPSLDQHFPATTVLPQCMLVCCVIALLYAFFNNVLWVRDQTVPWKFSDLVLLDSK